MGEIPWTWLAIRASGVTAWGLLTAVVVWGILLRTRILGRLTTGARLLDMHRWLGATAVAFLLVHLSLLLVDPAVRFTPAQVLIPGLAPWNNLAVSLGIIAFWLLIPVSIIGRMRLGRGRGSSQAWRRWFSRSHLIAYAAWPLATAHYVLAGTDALAQWSIALLIAGGVVIVMALLARGFVPAPAPTRTASANR